MTTAATPQELGLQYVHALMLLREYEAHRQRLTAELHRVETALCKSVDGSSSDAVLLDSGLVLVVREEWWERQPGDRVTRHTTRPSASLNAAATTPVQP